jgi:integrase
MATFQKLPSGKWRAQVRRSGIYKARSFDKKVDAQSWAAVIEQSISRGSTVGYITPPQGMTLGDLIDGFLETNPADISAVVILRAMAEIIGASPLAALNGYHLQRWTDAKLASGVTGSTIVRQLTYLGSVLRWGRRVRRLDIDETLHLEPRKTLAAARIQTYGQERDRYATDAELETIRAAIRDQERLQIPLEAIMGFALATAMRLGEICRIEHEDISPDGRTILIRDRKDPKRKVGNHQTVPLSSRAREIIATQPTTAGRVFPVATTSVSIAWRRSVDLAGVDNLTFHDLRHRAISDLFARGLAIQQVALVSGHKEWKQLRRYTQVQAADLLELLG